jgi:hypothetical protein
MTAEEPSYRRHRRTVIYGVVITAGWLAFTGLFGVPLSPPTPSDEGAPASVASTRQQVVIFVVDTQDAFDTHGAQVRSVIQRQCPLCTTQPINLHGDLSSRNIVQALLHVDDLSRQYDAKATLLVNVSLGSYTYDEILHTQVRRMRDAGLIFIAAAGNDDRDDPFYPAALPEVVGVCSSTRHSREKAAYSNYGNWASLCAPGWQFVRSPLQMGMASGTSFASPMVAGVLGQLLLDTPCATSRTALKALTRTAEPVAGSARDLGAGILSPDAARHYMQTLHACDTVDPPARRLVAGLRRFGSSVVTYAGLIVYFFVSVFTVPFLLAYTIERGQRRIARRQHEAVQLAFEGSSEHRRERVLALRQRFEQKGSIRRRDHPELMALLLTLYQYGEPCWWCDRPATEPVLEAHFLEATPLCQRCGLDLLRRDDG